MKPYQELVLQNSAFGEVFGMFLIRFQNLFSQKGKDFKLIYNFLDLKLTNLEVKPVSSYRNVSQIFTDFIKVLVKNLSFSLTITFSRANIISNLQILTFQINSR